MESLEPEIKLLYKFSNCKWVLSYYEDLPLWNVLMSSLWKTTKEWWNKNYEAFWNALEYTRRTFTYETEFNKEIAKYLLENARYKLYNLIVFISSKDSIMDLIDFISEVRFLSMLKFKKIVLKDSEIDIDMYNSLWNVLNEKKELDINKIKADNLNFSNKDSDELMEINHISCVKESKNISLFKQCQTYRIEHDTKHFIEYINNCNTIVHTLSFSLKLI